MIHIKASVFTWNLRNIKEATLSAPLLDSKAAPHTSKTDWLFAWRKEFEAENQEAVVTYQ